MRETQVSVLSLSAEMEATLHLPDSAWGLVIFAHPTGSSRHSPRNRLLAEELGKIGIATLALELLTREEAAVDQRTRHLRFDVPLLAARTAGALGWAGAHEELGGLPIGLLGVSTGAAVAIKAANQWGDLVKAIVCYSGRPDLVGSDELAQVVQPTLVVVGGDAPEIVQLNQGAFACLGSAVKRIEVVAGASHLFEEPGTFDTVIACCTGWFGRYLRALSGA
jgi:dienelactone hydrolase